MMYPNMEAERARLGMTKREFAKRLGASTNSYYNWINGKNPIPSNALIKMSKMCGTSIEYLLVEYEERGA